MLMLYDDVRQLVCHTRLAVKLLGFHVQTLSIVAQGFRNGRKRSLYREYWYNSNHSGLYAHFRLTPTQLEGWSGKVPLWVNGALGLKIYHYEYRLGQTSSATLHDDDLGVPNRQIYASADPEKGKNNKKWRPRFSLLKMYTRVHGRAFSPCRWAISSLKLS